MAALSPAGPGGLHLAQVELPSADAAVDASVGAKPMPVGGGHHRKGSYGDSLNAILGSNPMRRGLPKRDAGVAHQIEKFVIDMGGDRPIHSVLVANNGLAAVKFMRSVRSWCSQVFGNARAVALVALATPDDMRINAEHISMADQFIEVPGGSNANNYANVRLIVQLALRAGVDAVWPGWGHASENPDLPASLAEHNIRFLGPPAGPMAALGDKIGSTLLAQAAGVPTLPWSGSGVSVEYTECVGGEVPEPIYRAACVHSVEDALAACARIGYPIMLKASWGGGGKGIRKVQSDDEVLRLYPQVAGEVPGSPIFAMKLAPQSRHLEVQLLCDMHGGVVSLFSRDCSVQRRHQKIVEEGPVTAASQDTRTGMEACARALARKVGYVGAATVEFLYVLGEGRYYFLELNPRLQVEHPVTEGITGVNLPSCQLAIAMGIPLWRIPAIRALFNQDAQPPPLTPGFPLDQLAVRTAVATQPGWFDTEETPQRPPDGHVVAVRITSEDAEDGFKPTAGRIDELHFRPTPEVWGYFSVKSGGGIHEFSDSQFGHLFAHGRTREEALRAMVVALNDVSIRGEIRTTVDYVRDMLQCPEVVGNAVHTGWLDSRIASRVKPGRPPWHICVIAGAVVKGVAAVSSGCADFVSLLSKGQLPPQAAAASLTSLEQTLIIDGTKYLVNLTRRSASGWAVACGGVAVEVMLRKMADGGFLLQVDGGSHLVHAEEEPAGTRLLINGLTVLLAAEADPSVLAAPSPGKLVRRLVPSGARVARDMPYAEVEVMKMVMPLLAPAAGVITFAMPEGAVLSSGDLIARLQLDDPQAVVRAKPFAGAFPELGPPQVPSERIDHAFAAVLAGCHAILEGYVQPVAPLLEAIVACMDSPALALLQWEDEAAVVKPRLPQALVATLDDLLEDHKAEVETHETAVALGNTLAVATAHEFPAQAVLAAMDAAIEACPAAERGPLSSALEPLARVAKRHAAGREGYCHDVVTDLLERFLTVEEQFRLGTSQAGGSGPTTEQEAVEALRKSHPGHAGAERVLSLVLSHANLPLKSELLTGLLGRLVLLAPATYRPQLRRLAGIGAMVSGSSGAGGREVATLAVRAQQLLEQSLLADLRSVVARALSGLDMYSGSSTAAASPTAASAAAATAAGPASSPLLARRSLEAVAKAVAATTASGPASPPAVAGVDASGASPTSGVVRRSATSAEGVFKGLPHLGMSRGRIGSLMGVDQRAEMLVGAPAAVEDALASLMVEPVTVTVHSGSLGGASSSTSAGGTLMSPRSAALASPSAAAAAESTAAAGGDVLRVRAALTYIRRVYHHLLLREPVMHREDDGTLTAVWAYTDPTLANTPAPAQRLAALILLDQPSALGRGLSALAAQMALLDRDLRGLAQDKSISTLHLVLAGSDESLATKLGDAASSQALYLARSLGSSTNLDLTSEAVGGGKDGAAAGAGGAGAAGAAGSENAAEAGGAALLGVAHHVEALRALRVACVSVLARGSGAAPSRAGFRWQVPTPDAYAAAQSDPLPTGRYTVDVMLGQMEPVMASLLELSRMDGRSGLQYKPSRNRQWHLYSCVERPDARSVPLRRMFVRGVVRGLGHPALLAASYSGSASAVASAAVGELQDTLVGCLEELNRPQASAPPDASVNPGTSTPARPDWSHIYTSVLPPLPLPPGGKDDVKVAAALRSAMAALLARHASVLRQAGVAVWETRFRGPLREAAWRVVVSLPTGHEQGEEHVEVYREVLQQPDPSSPSSSTPDGDSPAPNSGSSSGCRVYVAALTDQGTGSKLAGLSVLSPYPSLERMQQKRLAARRHAVTYCYDYPSVFEAALRDIWAARAAAGEPASIPPAGRLVDAEEYALQLSCSQPQQSQAAGPCTDYRQPPPLQRVSRPTASNDCGMVVWVLNLKTPECPQGRSVVAVANDITWQSGAFSPAEDAVFKAAVELALEQRLPLIYLAANAGARVGLATEVRDCLQVEWVDPSDPSAGVKALYLTDSDYKRLSAKAAPGQQVVHATATADSEGAMRWVVHDVIGLEDGIGVECLSGSGAIASAFCRAFREGWTATLVSGRTVGIGAYLARLGRRCVQREDQPIVLTGFAALNKLLGRQVYTSHLQLGGPRVMGVNGVAHHVVTDDLEGAKTLLQLLAYAPAELGPGSTAAPLPTADSPSRPVTYLPPPGEKMDPRAAITGKDAGPSGGWQTGLFDKGSWLESQAGWARSVITGRARLGGVAVGVIAVENQTVQRLLPADPGMPDSCETQVPQAGQVWFPDSADKTAQAMEEFDLEGLPLIILANWRGFSGGQRDLFDGVLQAGSLIVERLRTFKQPVFVYIPAGAELRGGAWVVVDSQINPIQLEMYADPSARGGVLEPEGVCEIKFRQPDLLRMMHRVDPVLQAARAAGAAATDPALKARERELLPVYQRIARSFADMHDTPARMVAKGVLRAVVPWHDARRFLSVRLRRRLVEEQMARHITATDPRMERCKARDMVRTWFEAAGHGSQSWHLAVGSGGGLSPAAGAAGTASANTAVAARGSCMATSCTSSAWPDLEALSCKDEAFLEWAEGGMGRAAITSELKALRTRAAADLVNSVLGSAEGREGLLAALQSACSQDGNLVLQLRLLLSEQHDNGQ